MATSSNGRWEAQSVPYHSSLRLGSMLSTRGPTPGRDHDGIAGRTMVGTLAKDSVTRLMPASAILFMLTRTMLKPAQLPEAHSTTPKSCSFPEPMSANTSLRISAAVGSGLLIRRREMLWRTSRLESPCQLTCVFQPMVLSITCARRGLVGRLVPTGDTTAPTVSITNPADGSTVPRKGNVTVTATASDNVGVARVEFFVKGVLQCTDVSAPYSCNWRVNSAPNKTYQLQARAFDAAGNSATAAINVTSR